MIRENTMLSASNQIQSVRITTQQDAEDKEREISRLTWAVLDGQASREDRERLSKLVNNQYKQGDI